MHAIVRTEYGGPEALRFVSRERPQPATGEVLVRVEAAGLEIGTWHLSAGVPTMMRPALGLRAPRFPGLGTELSGVVEAVGPGVTRFAEGDEVWGTGSGALAEFAVASEKHLASRTGINAVDAAAAAISAVTAQQAIVASRLTSGGRVLVLGASGGVGSFVVQLAKALGAHVTAVASAGKLDFVRGLGADEVLDYEVSDPTDGSATYDAVIEMGGRRPWRTLRRALTPRGRAIIVGGEGGGHVTGGFLGNLAAGPLTGGRVTGLVSGTSVPLLEQVGRLLRSGAIRSAVQRVYPLDETAAAMSELLNGRVRGKLVIDPRRVAGKISER